MDENELNNLMEAVACGEVLPDEAVRRVACAAVSGETTRRAFGEASAGEARRALDAAASAGESQRSADAAVSGEATQCPADAAFADLGYAKPDIGRARRTGVAEVIYGEGKTPGQICGIVGALRDAGQSPVLITRLSADKAAAVRAGLAARDADEFEYREACRIGIVGALPEPADATYICVACAGTSDVAIAEEAAVTAEALGTRVVRLYDVGVAGIHRLLAHAGDIAEATAVVAVAGMEGALASVVAGMAACPVIAVPTSVGYGASFGGMAALLAMLNSCASGVSVVNIDNGFGAGYQAALIDRAARGAIGRAQ